MRRMRFKAARAGYIAMGRPVRRRFRKFKRWGRRGYSAMGQRKKMFAGALLMLVAIMLFPKVRKWIFKTWTDLGLKVKV